MPVYNAARYLKVSIESILNQTYRNWLLIIIDDGSTDESLTIAKRYAESDERISIIKMDSPSGGAYEPRKKGIVAATNDIVAPIDADDYVEPDYLVKLIQKKEDTRANIVYPTMWRPVESEDSILVTPTEEILYEAYFNGKDCVKFTLDGWKINCNGGLIDKGLYLKAFNKFEPDLPNTRADELLSRQLLLISPKVAFSEAKYFYRFNEGSITQRKSITNFDFVKNDIKLIGFMRAYYGPSSEEYILANRQAFHSIFDSLRILNKNKYTSVEKKKIYALLLSSKKKVDLLAIARNVSPRYKFIFKFNLKTMKFFLLILDKMLSWRK